MTRPSADTPNSEVVAEFPVSTTQERCWFLDQINPGEPALNVAVRWELRGHVTAAAIEYAFAHVIDRHEVLRTRFIERDGTPLQQVVASAPFRLGQFDLRTTPTDQRMARIDAIAHEEADRPFDLTQPGLIRANLVRFEADRAMLLIVAHQSVFDGYSIGVLGREIGTAAAAYLSGTEPDLPDLPLQYGDYALWQREYLAAGVLEEDGDYWRETLQDASYFEVPTDHPRPTTRSTKVRMAHRPMPADFASDLSRAARAAGVTPFTFGAAVVAACLHRLTGADEVLTGTQIAGRMDVDLEPLIGVFINNLVLRQPTRPDATLAEQIETARGVVEGALAHQSMPFNRLVEILNPPRDASRNPLISINFNLLEVFMKGDRYGTFELISVPSHAPGSVYDLQVVAIGRPEGGWRLTVEYRPDLFDEETVDHLLRLVEDGFAAAMSAPETELASLPISAALLNRTGATQAEHARISQAALAHPMVAEATTVAGSDGPWVFVTAENTGTTPLDQLPALILSFVAGLLPADAQPTGVSVLAALPRLHNGQVNAGLLRPPMVAGRASSVAQVTASDPKIEAALRTDWQELLGVQEIPQTASFFDLGGHSLLVVRLLARIRERHNIRLGLATVYENATLAALAQRISRLTTTASAPAEPASDWRVLRLHREGNGVPLIAINNAATALALSAEFQTPRPISCVRLFRSGQSLDVSNKSFSDIAADYAAVIRQAQPTGPYLLYGNCVHGNLALEAARHLAREGAEIAGVVMKDVWEPGYTDQLLANPELRRREKLQALRNKWRMVRDGRMTLSAMLGSYRIVRATGVLQMAMRLGLIDRVRQSDLEADQERFIASVTRARDKYRPDPLDLPVLHIVTRITPQASWFSPSIGWEKVVASADLHTVTMGDCYVHNERRVGIARLSQEIEEFLER